MVRIRIENPDSMDERTAIRDVNAAAFCGLEEADLVDKLRAEGHTLLSLVAILEDSLVGHIMFSRMWIKTPSGLISAVALAPVAVHPEHQRHGFGGLLIRRGLELLQQRGESVVLVVGHPDYYPKFGFTRERTNLIKSPFPPEVFMATELVSGSLDGIQGSVVYPPAFGIQHG